MKLVNPKAVSKKLFNAIAGADIKYAAELARSSGRARYVYPGVVKSTVALVVTDDVREATSTQHNVNADSGVLVLNANGTVTAFELS